MSRPQPEDALAGAGIAEPWAAVRRWLRWLTVLLLAQGLLAAFQLTAVLGAIIDFHVGEGVLIAGACGGGAAAGFALGWLSHRALGRLP